MDVNVKYHVLECNLKKKTCNYLINRVENTLLLLLLILSPCIVTEVEGFLHKRTRSENVRKQISIIPNQFNQDITAHASQ